MAKFWLVLARTRSSAYGMSRAKGANGCAGWLGTRIESQSVLLCQWMSVAMLILFLPSQAIAFRIGTLQLYTSSFDRTIKLFDLSTLSYIETLFGHQDCIQDLSALRAELTVSAGGRDKTCRFWKVTEESQLVFRGGAASRVRNVLDGGNEDDGIEEDETGRRRRKDKNAVKGEVKYVEGSIDVVAMVDDSTFLSGGDSGCVICVIFTAAHSLADRDRFLPRSICLWSITKKKPIFTVQLAHGVNEYESETEGIIGNARWITALGCMPYGDTFASGQSA